MVNRVVEKEKLLDETLALAARISEMPRFALALAKQAVNQAEDRMGLRETMDATYALHHLAHAHNALTSDDHLAGKTAKSMK
jgi:enoyl-CoA hydratase